jgi:hypothetical protein
MFFSKVPILGEVFDTAMGVVHGELDKEDQPKAGEEISPVNYDLMDELMQERLATEGKQQETFNQQMGDVSKQLAEYENELAQNRLNEENKVVDTDLTPQEIGQKAQEMMTGTGRPANQKLYDEIKEKVYKEQPRHSLFRSARIQKEYKEAGGTYIGDKPEHKGIKGWMDAKWISLNDYAHKGEIVPCGNARTEENYGEYPLCRPLKIAKKLGRPKILKMLKVKDEFEEKPLRTEEIFKTSRYNIQPSQSGGAKHDASRNKFHEELRKMGISPDNYLESAKRLAESKGYDRDKVMFAMDGDHKLAYDSPNGLKKFGKVGYGDYIIWSYLEKMGKVPKGTADKKRAVFKKSHSAMSKEYGLTKYTPNELALNINW